MTEVRPAEHGLTQNRASPVRASWRRRLGLYAAAVAGAGAGVAVAALIGAPEVAVLSAVVGVGIGAALVREATRPVAALAVAIEAAGEGGTIPGTTSGVGRDLSDRLAGALAAADRGREERDARLGALEALVRHADVALLAYDAGGRVLEMNLSARQLLGTGHLGRLADLPGDLGALRSVLERLSPGEHHLVEGSRAGIRYAIAVRGTAYVVAGRPVTAAALVDVRPDLEDREAEAWATLTRVLTHEIANSAGPIASLAETAARRLGRGDTDGAADALATVGRRADGLVRFVEAYRAVARVPTPDRAPIAFGELLHDVASLLLTGRGDVSSSVVVEPPDLVGYADPALVEQAVINLVRNALQAVEGRGDARVELSARPGPRGRSLLTVTDNGPGIPPEALGRVFVPFYTTHEGGSGIGLALCRQIARVHGGRIDVASEPGRTALTLVL